MSVRKGKQTKVGSSAGVLAWGLAGWLASTCAVPLTVASQATDKPFVLRQNVEEVLLYCTVTDAKANAVTDLSKSAFHIREDGKDVTISHFSREDVPVSLSLVLDASGSMREKRPAVQAAALALIKASNVLDETSITNFADKAYVDQQLTGDIESLESGLTKGKTISGGTALYDTISYAADKLAKGARHSKQVIVVVTDGSDNASVSSLAAAIQRVQQIGGPVVYAIGLLYDVPRGEAGKARKELLALADQTGGIAFFPPSLNQVTNTALEVAADIRSQYSISFHPAERDLTPAYHTVAVTADAAGRGHLSVRTRRGYARRPATSSTSQVAD